LFDERPEVPNDVATDKLAPFQPESETSYEAAFEKSEDARVTERLRVYGIIKGCGFVGATREEIALALEKPINEICPRVWELLGSGGRHKASVYESNDRRKTQRGRNAAVLKAM
jgi:hypothetical protein